MCLFLISLKQKNFPEFCIFAQNTKIYFSIVLILALKEQLLQQFSEFLKRLFEKGLFKLK